MDVKTEEPKIFSTKPTQKAKLKNDRRCNTEKPKALFTGDRLDPGHCSLPIRLG